ncbi:MAG: PaaI family thioesterase [Thermoprotei archaeon]
MGDLSLVNSILSNDPIASHLGLKVVELREGFAATEFPYKIALTRPGGIINGGMICAAIDYTGGIAVLTVNDKDDQVTAELKVNFLEPLREGPFRVQAQVVRKGRTLVTVEAKVFDAEGRLGAIALGTWYLI